MILSQKRPDETNKDFAYRTLKDNIMNFNLKPGQAISEVELSEKLNISRTPIREILSKLKQEYLIDVYPQIGTYISLIDFNLIRQALFMRQTLEKEVLKLACNDFPIYNLIELEKSLLSQKLIMATSKDEVEFEKLDFEFHEILFDGVGMQDIWSSIIMLSSNYKRMRLMYGIYHENNINEQVLNQHEEILNIIKNKDIDKIDILIDKHIKSSLDKWIDFVKSDKNIQTYVKNLDTLDTVK